MRPDGRIESNMFQLSTTKDGSAMTAAHNLFDTLQQFSYHQGQTGRLYSLPQLEAAGIGSVSRLPVSIRIVLESVLRNVDGTRITEDHVRRLANWEPQAERSEETPFIVARIVRQDVTGVPVLVGRAATSPTV